MISVIPRVQDRSFFFHLRNPEKSVFSEEAIRGDIEATNNYRNRREAEIQKKARSKCTSDETSDEALVKKKERSEGQLPEVED